MELHVARSAWHEAQVKSNTLPAYLISNRKPQAQSSHPNPRPINTSPQAYFGSIPEPFQCEQLTALNPDHWKRFYLPMKRKRNERLKEC